MATNQFDKALALIQELNETSGKQIAENYKSQILSGKFQNAEITNLEQLIEKIRKKSLIIFDIFVF
jgi:hypothetical protein